MAFQNGSGQGNSPQAQPIFNSPRVVTLMIGIWVGIWLVQWILPRSVTYPVTTFLSFIPAQLSYDFPASIPGFLLSAVTYQFLHSDFMHLALNSLWMLALGTIVARRLELKSFIVFFLVCGAIGAAVHLLFWQGSFIPVVGASGAISGLLGAAGRFALFPPQGGWHLSMYAPHTKVVPLRDRRLQAFVGVMIVLNLVFGLGSGFGTAGAGQLIAWDIHIAGLFAGLLLFPKFDAWRSPPRGDAGGDAGRGGETSYLRRVK